MRLGEALDERERLVGDLALTAVDRERVPAVWDPRDLGDTGVPSLLLVRRVDDCPRHRVILLTGYEQQRAAVGTLAVDLRRGPRIEVGARGLEQRSAGRRDVERLVQLLRLVLAQAVGPAVLELLDAECDGTVPIGGVPEHWRGGLQRGDRKRKHAAKGRRIDRNGGRRQPASGDDLRQQPAERVTDDGRLLREARR